MVRQSRAAEGLVLGALLLSTHSALANNAVALPNLEGATAQQVGGYEVRATRGAQSFEEGNFDEALQHFEAALALLDAEADGSTDMRTDRGPARATLHFNAAACLMELGRYHEAEQRFVQAAALDDSQRGLATAQAGIAALAGHRLDIAANLLTAVETFLAESEDDQREQAGPEPPRRGHSELDQALAELRRGIAAERREQQRTRAYVAASRDATRALRARDFATSLRAVERALALAKGGQSSERAALHYSAGVAALALERYELARDHVLRALELDPNDAASYELLARAELARREPEAAEAYFARARANGIPPELLEPGEKILAHNPLVPTSGWGGWLQVTAGFDSNPIQSGAGNAANPTGTSGSGSTLLGALGEVGYGWSLAGKTVVRPFYTPEWLWLLSDSARDNSLQSHELGVGLHQGLSRSWLLAGSLSRTWRWTGRELQELLSNETWAGLELARRWSEANESRIELRGAWVEGGGRWTYLSGPRWEARLRHTRHWRHVALGASAGFRYEGWGTKHLPVTPQDYSVCSRGRCAGATYEIPLAYTAPRIDATLSWYPTARLKLALRSGYEYRRYAAESYISTIASVSRKLREDHRFRLGTGLEWRLDDAGTWSVLAGYRWLLSDSNMAYDPEDPAHALDYADRAFDQHLVETGVTLDF